MDYRLYPLKNQERLAEICALFATGLAETTPDYWKWKHYSENGLPEGMILVAEAEDGSFAGMFAMQPAVYACGGKKLTIVQTEDLVIDPSHRGSGLMKKLYNFAWEHYSERGSVGFMAFCNDTSFPIFLKYGAVDMGDIYSRNTAKSLLPVYSCKKEFSGNGWSISLCAEMPNDLFHPGNSDAFAMEKNDSFMKWKFADNPDGPFFWLTLRKDGQLKGYIVVHITQGRLRRAVNIYDWALDSSVDDYALSRAVALLRTHGNWVSLWGLYSEDVLARWARAGVDKKSENGTHFLLHAFNGQELPTKWHLTRADLDY